MMDIAVAIPLYAEEIVDWALVLDKRGNGVLYVLRPTNVLLAWPGRQIDGSFDFDVTHVYPFVLTAKQVQAVHPAKGVWNLDELRVVIQGEMARVNAVGWN